MIIRDYTLYTNKVDTDDGGYIECFLYLDNVNKVSFTYYNKHKNTKDMTKEDANKEVIKFLDDYVTIKKKIGDKMKKITIICIVDTNVGWVCFKEQGTTIPHGQTQETEKKPAPDVRLLKTR